jgi:hypothetical protein
MKRREALKTLGATTLTGTVAGGLAGALAPMPAAAPGETCGRKGYFSAHLLLTRTARGWQ